MSTVELLNYDPGGKARSWFTQYDAGNADFLLPLTLVNAAKFDKGERMHYSFKYPQIARASIVNDEIALVDLIKTLHDQSSEDLNHTEKAGEIRYLTRREKDLIRSGQTSYYEELEGVYPGRNASEEDMNVFISLVNRKIEEYEKGKIEIDPSSLEKIIMLGKSEMAYDIAHYDGIIDYNGVSSIMIQPQNKYVEINGQIFMNLNTYHYCNMFRGSAMEHPNIKDHYLINIVRSSIMEGIQLENGIAQYLVDINGNIIIEDARYDFSEKLIKDIVVMKRKSREANFASDDIATQVEFVFFNKKQPIEFDKYEYETKPSFPVIFTQEREVVPISYDSRMKPDEYTFNRFGDIPPEGVELRVVKLGERGNLKYFSDGEPTAYVFDHSSVANNIAGIFQPNNMTAFIVPKGTGTLGGNSIEHNTLRWIQKAKYSLLFQEVDGRINYNDYKTGEKIVLK